MIYLIFIPVGILIGLIIVGCGSRLIDGNKKKEN